MQKNRLQMKTKVSKNGKKVKEDKISEMVSHQQSEDDNIIK